MFQKLYPAILSAALLATSGLVAGAGAQAASAQNPKTVEEGAYAVEPLHTRVLFGISHFGFSTYYGEFTSVSGSLTLTPKSVGKSEFEIHIPVNTVSTSNAKLDGELKSPQWLDATQFPEMVFKSKQITETGKDTARVTGDLTLHGVTKPVTLTVTFHGAGVNPVVKKYTVGFDARGMIKRSDFGVKTYLPLVGDEVELIISAAFEHS